MTRNLRSVPWYGKLPCTGEATDLTCTTRTSNRDSEEVARLVREFSLHSPFPSNWRVSPCAPIIIEPPKHSDRHNTLNKTYLIRACDTAEADKRTSGRYVRLFKHGPSGWEHQATFGPYTGRTWKRDMADLVYYLHLCVKEVLPLELRDGE